ncbi:MAG: D-alanine--D-alanine ligase family protein [Anaerolineales bacterium]|jgi:D-alanine-D-alanine ligase
MSDKIRVGVLFGGRSGEHEVSLMSARSVLNAINRDRYDVLEIGITHQGTWLTGDRVLESFLMGKTEHLNPVTILPDPTRPGLYVIRDYLKSDISTDHAEISIKYLFGLDVVFPVLHGTFGEDGTLQGMLEMAGLAYVGAGVLGSSLGMDKGVFKDVMRANDIPVLDWLIVLKSELETDMEKVLTRSESLAAYPLFAKPANLGSSVGVSKCKNRSDLIEGLMDAARFDRRIIVEKGLNAREIEISVIGNDRPQASVPGEIRPAAEFYSYDAKYHDDRSELLIPAPLHADVMEEARDFALRAYKVIDCAGMARVDFLLDKDTGNLYLNELNTIPGFTQISMYPKLWDASGVSYPELIDQLIQLALERKNERDRIEWRYERQEIHE